MCVFSDDSGTGDSIVSAQSACSKRTNDRSQPILDNAVIDSEMLDCVVSVEHDQNGGGRNCVDSIPTDRNVIDLPAVSRPDAFITRHNLINSDTSSEFSAAADARQDGSGDYAQVVVKTNGFDSTPHADYDSQPASIETSPLSSAAATHIDHSQMIRGDVSASATLSDRTTNLIHGVAPPDLIEPRDSDGIESCTAASAAASAPCNNALSGLTSSVSANAMTSSSGDRSTSDGYRCTDEFSGFDCTPPAGYEPTCGAGGDSCSESASDSRDGARDSTDGRNGRNVPFQLNPGTCFVNTDFLNARDVGPVLQRDVGVDCGAIELQDMTPYASSGNSVPDYSMVGKQLDSGQVLDADNGHSAQSSDRSALTSDSSTVEQYSRVDVNVDPEHGVSSEDDDITTIPDFTTCMVPLIEQPVLTK